MPTYFTAQRLPRCCGLIEIGGFGYIPSREALTEDLKSYIKGKARDHGGEPGMLVATVNDLQKVARRALEDNGFEVLREFFNPKSLRQVFLMGRTINQPKPKVVMVKVMPAPMKEASRKLVKKKAIKKKSQIT